MIVTAEQADIIRATPEGGTCFLVVEGEFYADDALGVAPRYIPPADWAALAGACECATSAFDLAVQHKVAWIDHQAVYFDPGCPDCIAGRKRTTLTVCECGPFWPVGHPMHVCICPPLATVTVEVLPVVDDDDGCPGAPHVNMLRLPLAGETLIGSCDGNGNAPEVDWTLSRLPVPGRDFVVVLSDVRSS